MNILYLTQFFDPEPGFMGLDFMKALRLHGHEIEVLTGFPNYPGGKIYPGYKIRCRQVEIMDGIKVVRVPLYPNHDRSGFKRIMNYASFGISAATIGQFGLKRPDVVYCYNLPTLGMAASLIRFFRGSKIVLSVQDLWPESVSDSGMLNNRLLQRVLAWRCNAFYRRADAMTVLSPGFKDNLIEKGVKPERIEVVYNWCNEKAMRPVEPRMKQTREPFVVVFAGNMGRVQCLETVLDAAKRLRDQSRNILFRFIGGGTEVDRLKQRSQEMDLTNTEFLPSVPMEQISDEYEKADALLVHLQALKLLEITIPSKTQAYLYTGKPILCGLKGDAARIIEDSQSGICFEPENAESLANAVIQMSEMSDSQLEEMGKKGHKYYMEHLCFEKAVEKIDKLLKFSPIS